MRLRAERIGDRAAELGESPIWDERDGVLRWIDGPAGLVHAWKPGLGYCGALELGEPVKAIGLRRRGGLLVVHGRRLVLLAPEQERRGSRAGERELCELPLDPSDGLNDGAADRFGTYWVGSVSEQSDGHLYRVHTDGSVDAVLGEIGMSNGIDWSPGGEAMYYVDTRSQRVDRLTVALADGSVSTRRPFAAVPPETGLPDGLAVDEEGGVWLAVWGAGEVRRYRPDGALDAVVDVPARNATSCAFGGIDLRTLFITSARQGLSAADLAQEPEAGALFALEAPVRGLRAARFGA